MYLKRKIDDVLDDWITRKDYTPMLLVGIRQCGKTETIREFAKRNNFHLIEINFWNNPNYISDFNGELDVDSLISNISLRFPNDTFNPENTLIFLMKFKSVLEQGFPLKILKMIQDIKL